MSRLFAPFCLVALAVLACGQVARRPPADTEPWWEGNPTQPHDVQPDTSTVGEAGAADETEAPGRRLLARAATPDSGGTDTVQVTLAGLGPAPAPRPRPASTNQTTRSAELADSSVMVSPEVLAARRGANEARDRDQRERAKRVNEYAYWCVKKGLWDEARIHLEQAVVLDSMSASLHNNLGILYEREGARGKALGEYEMATHLQPGKRLYKINLRRLQSALERPFVRPDSLARDTVLDSTLAEELYPVRKPQQPNRTGE